MSFSDPDQIQNNEYLFANRDMILGPNISKFTLEILY